MCGDIVLTDREKEIMGILRKGINSPTILATELKITQSGATQALQKLTSKGLVKRSKAGRNVFYRPIEEEKIEPTQELNEDLDLIRESYHSLSKVWSHLLRLDLTKDELAKVRDARNLLEEILVKRGKSLD
jgi:predicted transcriptional regulator